MSLRPPWKPLPGHGDYREARRLSDEQLALLARWVDGGMPEGDPKDLPPAPEALIVPVTLIVNGRRVVRSVRAGTVSYRHGRVRSVRIIARDAAGNLSPTLKFR